MCPDFLQGLRETIVMGKLHVAEFVLLEPFSRPGNKENGKPLEKSLSIATRKEKLSWVQGLRWKDIFRPKWNVFLLTVKVETAFNLGLRPVFPLKRADGDVYGRNLPLGINKTCLHPIIIHGGEVSDKDIPWWNSNSVARRSEKLFYSFFLFLRRGSPWKTTQSTRQDDVTYHNPLSKLDLTTSSEMKKRICFWWKMCCQLKSWLNDYITFV